MDESLFASFSSEKEVSSLSSLDVLLRGLGFALVKGARLTVKVEIGDREAALLERELGELEHAAAMARAALRGRHEGNG